MSRSEEQELLAAGGIGNPGDPAVGLRFESPPGTVVELELEPGQSVRICGTVVGALGLGEPFLPVEFSMWSTDPEGAFPPYLQNTNTNLVGNYWFDITLPSVICQAQVKVCARFALTTPCNSAGIGIGAVAPPPEESLWEQFWTKLGNAVVYGTVGLFVVGGIVIVSKAFSKKRPSERAEMPYV